MKHALDHIVHAQEKAKKFCIDEKCIDWQKQTFMDISFHKFPLDFRSKEGRVFRKKCNHISSTSHLKKFTTILSKLPVIEQKKEVVQLDHCSSNILHTIQKYCSTWWKKHTKLQKGRGYFMSFIWQNDVDPVSQDDVRNIPKPYVYTYIDPLHHVYVFDVRTLYTMFQSKMFQNPFNMESFDACFINDVKKRIQHLQTLNYNVAMEDIHTQPAMSLEKMNDQNTLKVLQTLDHMGYHITMEMFQQLTNAQHIKWYLSCEDIFNYRAELTAQAKENIAPTGNVFPLKSTIKTYASRTNSLLKYVLQAMLTLSTTGVTESDRVTGSMFIITAWTECSDIFRTSFPMLYQPP